jgi:hypothetical protein
MMSNPFRLLVLSVLVGSPFSRDASPANGQEFPLPAGTIADLQPELQPSARAAALRYATPLYQRLLLKLDEMDRVSKLSEAQRGKLEVAAKGAVDHALDRWLTANSDRLRSGATEVLTVRADVQQQAQQQARALQAMKAELEGQIRQAQLTQRALARIPDGARGANAAGREAGEENAREVLARQHAELLQQQQVLEREIARLEQNARGVQVVAANDIILGGFVPAQPQPNARPARTAPNSALIMNSDASAVAEQDKIWTTAVESTLTNEQKNRLQAAAAKRSAFQPASAIEIVLKEIDQRLLLDGEQYEQLVPLVEEVIKQQSTEEVLRRSPSQTVGIAANVLRALPEEKLKTILSQAQQAQRQRSLVPQGAPQNAINVNQDAYQVAPVEGPFDLFLPR